MEDEYPGAHLAAYVAENTQSTIKIAGFVNGQEIFRCST